MKITSRFARMEMSDTFLKVVKVFIGSPGGLTEERGVAKRVIEEINRSHAEHWGCELKLVGWEMTLPGFSRAQALINQDLDKCDYFVGVLWNHWGSKPDDGDSRYSSGFEEEFYRAQDRVQTGAMKDIALYFKKISDVQLLGPGPSVAKVLAFRDECISRRKPLFRDFVDARDFESFLRAKLEEIGWTEAVSREDEAAAASTDAGDAAQANEQKALVASSSDRLVSRASALFVSDVIERSSSWEETTPQEIARFRLISVSLSRWGNDEMYVGNHDANLLYLASDTFDFAEQEIRALIDAGVAGWQSQNVPLWNWVAAAGESGLQRIRTLSAFGKGRERANAIRLLAALELGVPDIGGTLDPSLILRSWLVGEHDGSELEAALFYLRHSGTLAEIAYAEGLLPEIEAKKSSVIVAIIAATLRFSTTAALEALIRLDPETIDEELAHGIMPSSAAAPVATLERCLLLRAESARRRAAQILAGINALSAEAAHRLLTDKDYDIRLVATESLVRAGRRFDDTEVKGILHRPSSKLVASLGGAAGDAKLVDKYHENRLAALGYVNLVEKVQVAGFFDNLPLITLYKNYAKRCISDIRRNLDDGFATHIALKIADLEARLGAETKVVQDTRDVAPFVKGRLLFGALEAICRVGLIEDLPRVRNVLDRFEIDFSEVVLGYLGRVGDWSDRDRILAFEKRYKSSWSLLTAQGGEKEGKIAAALSKVAKGRLLELLDLPASIGIRRAIIMQLAQTDVASLSDDKLLVLLNDSDDDLRRTVARRVAVALTQARIRKLLRKYVDHDGQRYYNSIHWLDLGASMPRKRVRAIVDASTS